MQRWERHSKWPLAAAAVLFLGVFSVEVLAEPQGHQAHVLWLVSWTTWGLFILDYVARLCLASDRGRWFLHHLLDFAIVALRGRIVVYTVSGVLLLIYTASLAVFEKERYQHGATINSFGKALWWSITTVTTVGYGDVYPVTNTGRVIAVLLMIGGISLVGVVTAALASWIIQSVAVEETASQTATAAHIDELRSEIGNLRQELQARG